MDPRDALRMLLGEEPSIEQVQAGEQLISAFVDEVRKRTSQNPNDSASWNVLGGILANQARWDEAEAAFREVVRLDPGDTTGRENLGLALHNLGRLEEAASEYQSALHQKPTASTHCALAGVFFDGGKIDKALDEWKAAIQLDPSHEQSHWNLAVHYYNTQQYPEARKHAEKTAKLNPSYPHVGELLREIKKKTPSLYRRVISRLLNPAIRQKATASLRVADSDRLDEVASPPVEASSRIHKRRHGKTPLPGSRLEIPDACHEASTIPFSLHGQNVEGGEHPSADDSVGVYPGQTESKSTMPEPLAWRVLPVFVSSTFRDMNAERDILRDVFAELAERIREHRLPYHVEPIDLRWGVETRSVEREEEKERLVLQVCLQEIERSRPYVLVLLGDRYGWVPPARRIETAMHEAGAESGTDGKSVTHLEIEYGILQSGLDQPVRSLVYFRRPMDYERMPVDLAVSFSDAWRAQHAATEEERAHARLAVGQLDDLKRRIRDDKRLAGRVREYSATWDPTTQSVRGLDDFARQLLDDLWDLIKPEVQADQREGLENWQAMDRREIEDFVEHRSRGFVGRQALLANLLNPHPTSGDGDLAAGVCVVGEPGSGKSAVFAKLHRELLASDTILLSHVAGIGPRSTSVDAMLRRWIGELAHYLHQSDPESNLKHAQEVEACFASLLHQATQLARVVLLIDALDQFEPTAQAQDLTWLPTPWPANAYMITTAIPGRPSQAFEQKAGFCLTPLEPLREAEARAIAESVCKRYHRTLSPDLLTRLMRKKRTDGTPAARSPLWTTLTVEELNLLGSSEFAIVGSEDDLYAMMESVIDRMPPTVTGMYDFMLDQTEQEHGTAWTSAFACLVAVSRAGCRESDLMRMLPVFVRAGSGGEAQVRGCDEMRLARLRRAFRAHLIRRGLQQQWDFFHLQIRHAVFRRYLTTEDRARLVHQVIVEHYNALPEEDPIRQSELMYHLIQADDRLGAAKHYADADGTTETAATRTLAEHLLEVADASDRTRTEWVCSLLDEPQLEGFRRARLCAKFNLSLADTLEYRARQETRLSVAEKALQVLRMVPAEENDDGMLYRALAAGHDVVGDVHLARGDPEKAMASFRAAEAVLQPLLQKETPDAAIVQDLSCYLVKIGDVLINQGKVAEAQSVRDQSFKLSQFLADEIPNAPDIQDNLCVSYQRRGHALMLQGRLEEALEAQLAGRSILERLTTEHPTDAAYLYNLGTNHNDIGDVLLAQGDSAGAADAYRQSVEINRRLVQQEPTSTLWRKGLAVGLGKLGDAMLARGEARSTIDAFEEMLTITQGLADHDPTNATWQSDVAKSNHRLGHVYLALGQSVDAIPYYRTSLAITRKLSEAHPRNDSHRHDVAAGYSYLGDAQMHQGDAARALESYRASLTFAQDLGERNPKNLDWQRDLAVALEKVGNAVGRLGKESPLSAHRSSLEIRQRLVQEDPANTVWLRDLSVSQGRIGMILQEQGDGQGAVGAYREALDTAKRLSEQDPANREWQRDLMCSSLSLGDGLLVSGDPDEALFQFRHAVKIAGRLAAEDATDARQHDVWNCQRRIGDVLTALGDLKGALKAYQTCLAISEALVQADSDNSAWHRALSTACAKLAGTFGRMGSREEFQWARRSLAILERRDAAGWNASPTQ